MNKWFAYLGYGAITGTVVSCSATKSQLVGKGTDNSSSSASSAEATTGAGGKGGDLNLTVGSGGAGGGGPPVDKCHVPPDDMSGNAPVCKDPPAPPDSFSPKTKWTWNVPANECSNSFGIEGSIVLPLVGNFTDDDKNGEINLCDVPDVLVTTWGASYTSAGKIYMLSGNKGALELVFDDCVASSVTPAFGDVDGDGKPEVVTNDPAGHIVIYDEKGHIQTVGPDVGFHKTQTQSYCHAIAIYDLDADGKPEIISAFEVYDNKGVRKFHHPITDTGYWCPANTAADLDGDGKLEVIFGNAAYRANGQQYWAIPGPPGQPQVANLDADPQPEIFIARRDGLLVLEHDGKIKYGPIKPFNEPDSPNCWSKPAAVHDFDGDGVADVIASACLNYGVMKVLPTGLQLNWGVPVNDTSGLASSTGFDFLGKGIANAVYGDQMSLLVLDGKTGKQNLSQPRSSGTLIEYPVVADIDNDNSADIVVVSNKSVGQYQFTVQAFEDSQKRWKPTRRIWNQHAYHVTNVREDGTIPKVPVKSWLKLNTFRTNAQIQGGADCAPPPPTPK